MDIKNLDVVLSVDCFNSICRTCLGNLNETVGYNVNDFLIQQYESTSQDIRKLAIGEVLTKCTPIKVLPYFHSYKNIRYTVTPSPLPYGTLIT